MAKISDPFRQAPPPAAIPGLPPRFLPSAGTPSPVIPEQARAEQIPAGIARGDHAPRYGDVVTRPPFTPTTSVPVNANPAPKAGGSKS